MVGAAARLRSTLVNMHGGIQRGQACHSAMMMRSFELMCRPAVLHAADVDRRSRAGSTQMLLSMHSLFQMPVGIRCSDLRPLARLFSTHEPQSVGTAHRGTDARWEISVVREWSDMPAEDQEAWSSLGWTPSNWKKRNILNPTTKNPAVRARLRRAVGLHDSWKHLQGEERAHAEWLGFTENSWSPKFHSHKDLEWDSLDEASREHWQQLGYSGSCWDNNVTPAPCKKDWDSLTAQERESALLLGYTRHAWDRDSDELNPSQKDSTSVLWVFLVVFIVLMLKELKALTESNSLRAMADRTEDQTGTSSVCRVPMKPREQWQQRCEARGFRFHSSQGVKWDKNVCDTYWNENAAYVLTEESRRDIESGMWELHNMCLLAVDAVVRDVALMDAFEIPPSLRYAVQESWRRRQPDLIGRFDLLVSGDQPPKLLEYNADTPTLLVEGARVQEDWAAHHAVTQFNKIDQLLVESWPKMLARAARAWGHRYSDYLIYLYKNTNTDPPRPHRSAESVQPVLFAARLYTQITCFTSTKVRILTQKTLLAALSRCSPCSLQHIARQWRRLTT